MIVFYLLFSIFPFVICHFSGRLYQLNRGKWQMTNENGNDRFLCLTNE
jgi:hypothetical protein